MYLFIDLSIYWFVDFIIYLFIILFILDFCFRCKYKYNFWKQQFRTYYFAESACDGTTCGEPSAQNWFWLDWLNEITN